MNKYTVVGLYESNNQRFCDHVQARDVVEAIGKARKTAEQASDYLNVAGVFEGHLMAKDTGAMGEDDE